MVYALWNIAECFFIIIQQIICVTQEAAVNFSFIICSIHFGVTVVMTLIPLLLDQFAVVSLCYNRLLAASWNRHIFGAFGI